MDDIVLEDLIKNNKYSSTNIYQPPVKKKAGKSPAGSPRKTFDPIVVKVEESTSAPATNLPSTTSHSLLIENNCQRELKQENQILSRIAELRRQGLWSSSRLPLCVEPPRSKAHWDFLLEEMKWMATDFRNERNIKKTFARKIASAIAKQKRDAEMDVERAEQKAVKEGKRIAGAIAKMVDEFWRNVDKVVEYRAQEIIKSRKRKAQAQHLEFIVGEATKLSSLVQEGLTADRASKTPSVASKDDLDDGEFDVSDTGSDDESTIAKEEKAMKDEDVTNEIKSLEKEADQDFDDLFASLPPEYLESLGIKLPPSGPSTSKPGTSRADDDEASKDAESGPSTPKRRKTSTSSSAEKASKENKEETMEVDEATQNSAATGTSGSPDKDESQAPLPNSEGNGDGRGVLENVNYDKLNSKDKDDRKKELDNIAEEALKFQPKGYTLDTTQVKTQVPFLIRGTLREYQMVGLDWLVTLYENNLNGILADEMGLGKTIQTIALLAHLACSERIWGPHLIVVPTSVILNWEMELKKWCPALKILTYFGGLKERQEKRKGWNRPHAFHVCITSYKTVTTDIRSFKMKAWQYLILDEAQNIKNWKSQRWQALLNVRARRRLLLTGTPLQNSLMELWSLLHFLMPAVFGSHDDFKDWFSNPLTGMMDGSVEYSQTLVLRPFILRRLKREVEKQLPEKTEKVIKCPLSKRQRYLYDDFMSRRSTKENLKTGNMVSVLNIVMQLRKCCNHPNLFEPRPVVAPFILQPRQVVYPAMVMNLCKEEDETDETKKLIPEGLMIARRYTGWAPNTPYRRSAPLIEELEQWHENAKPPKVDGFRFQRPALDKDRKQQPSTSQAPAVVDISSAELERAGFGENEMFLVVKEGDDLESLLSNSEGAPVPMRVRVENGRVVLDNTAEVQTPTGKTRLCQEVTGQNGEKTLREVSGGVGTSKATLEQQAPQKVADPHVDGVPAAALLGNLNTTPPVGASPSSQRASGAAPSTSQAPPSSISSQSYPQIVTYKSLMQQQKQLQLTAHPSLRSQIMKHDNQPANPATPQKGGFHDRMTNGGTRDNIHNADYLFSPPLKRRKRSVSPLVKGEYSEYVPDYVLKNLSDERRKRLEIVQDRFQTIGQTTPVIPNQLLDVLQREFCLVKRSDPDKFVRNIFAAKQKEEVGEKLAENAEWIAKRFTLFINAAECDAPKLQATSGGRKAFFKSADSELELASRKTLEMEQPLTDAVLLARKLQFPELRLIEYDCGKLQVMSSLLRELYLYKHRCLIFTQMSRMLDVLQAFLSYHGYQYFRLDGTTGVEQRQAMMERFNADSKIFCFIMSTRAGGIGVNLTGADTVIFYDSDWNYTMDAQAQDRCHRIGQTRNVTIYRLISEKTIEENILKKAMQKRKLGEVAIDEAGFTPEFFKKTDNIRDLFAGEEAVADIVAPVEAPRDQKELEKAMASLEDEQDVAAAKIATAEAGADKAEFDEAAKAAPVSLLGSIDEAADEKYIELINQLKPIERYAINCLEAEYKPEFEEDLRETEALIDQQKEEWVRSHEKAIEDIESADGEKPDNIEDDLYIGGTLLDEVRNKSSSLKKPPNSSASQKPLRVSSRRALLDSLSATKPSPPQKSEKSAPKVSITPKSKPPTPVNVTSSTPKSEFKKPTLTPNLSQKKPPKDASGASKGSPIVTPPRSSFGRQIKASSRLKETSPPRGLAGLVARLHRSTSGSTSSATSPTTMPTSGTLKLPTTPSNVIVQSPRRSVTFANPPTSAVKKIDKEESEKPKGRGRPPKKSNSLRRST
ncbi:hypothetical protein WR25_04929 [Diploscapter pachys]|uniref:Uncharacterized protein n=1 Tax=Diploscapter pachys TaxID=2018661 RepID=A0A2A2JR23_9BILA|nr:hypothetical protein WR25_04929 [Diploscapter pachys]